MKVDLIIKNGTVVTALERYRVGVAVDDGKVVAIAKEVNLPEAEETIDASGMFVLPGLVDSHAHFRDPGYTHKEDYETGSRCAAAGGVTMVMPQPNVDPAPTTLERWLLQVDIGEKKSCIDFNPAASPLGGEEEIQKLAEAGTCDFDIFQKVAAYPYSSDAGERDSAKLFKVFQAVAKTGLSCSVIPCNMELFEMYSREWEKMEDKFPEGVERAHAWDVHFRRPEIMESAACMLKYLAQKSGVRWYAGHCGQATGYISLVKLAKAEGQNVIADTSMVQCFPVAHVGYELDMDVSKNLAKIGWKALLDGTLDFVNSDHAPHLKREVEVVFTNPTKAGLGYGRLENFGPLLFNEVNKGSFSLETLVRIASENPAKCFNMYPRKGAIQVGSDADVVIVNMKAKAKITNKRYPASKGEIPVYTKCGYTGWEGVEVQGIPVYTICRGTVVMRDLEVIGKPGHGQLIKPSSLPMPGYQTSPKGSD